MNKTIKAAVQFKTIEDRDYMLGRLEMASDYIISDEDDLMVEVEVSAKDFNELCESQYVQYVSEL